MTEAVMLRLRSITLVVLCAALGSLVEARRAPADERLIVSQAGALPVLITAPHGGTTPIPHVPPRREREGDRVNLRRDELTNRLAILTADELERRLGHRPYLVVAEFSRKSLDANRPAASAFQHAGAAPFYRDYHGEIARFLHDIRERWAHGLLLDLHAQWLKPDVVMRGTRDGQTVRDLIERRGWEGLLGPGGLLGSLQADGITLFPPQVAGEGDWTHLGSHTVATYSGEGIDAVQLEIGSNLCDSEQDVRRLAVLLADGIQRHLRAEGQLPSTIDDRAVAVAVAAEDERKDAQAPPSGDKPALTDAEQAFVDLLTDSVLVGRYSIAGREGGGAQPERYAISRVTKVGGDKWIVEARITYGKVDIPLPVPVEVHWAGDTPVISLTDLRIPGLGEGFTTRVLFYKDRYAGSWYHGAAGGHMWGKIEKAAPKEPAREDAD